MNYKLLIAIILFIIANILTWFQVNSQFIWDWWKARPMLTVLIYAFPTSLSFFYAWKFGVEAMGGQLWPVRMVGFGISTIMFTGMTYFIMREGLTAKTITCLFLSILIILIQVLWK
jgi:hypothetical protein